MNILKKLWTEEEEDQKVKTAYQYVVDMRDRIEETCEMAQRELMKVQNRNQKYYNRRAKNRKLNIGDSALLLLPTEHNKLTLSWRGPYKVVDNIGDVNYKVEIAQGKIKTYHINMPKRYYHRKEFERNQVGQQMTNRSS